MRRNLLAFALLAAALAPVACRTSMTQSRRDQVRMGALIKRTVNQYHVIYSENDRGVGFIKVFDIQEGGGPTYQWKYVYDNDWTELGFVDQFGTAYRYEYYGQLQQEIHDKTFRTDRMGPDSIENNVMRMLGINPAFDNVSFPVATSQDIAGGG